MGFKPAPPFRKAKGTRTSAARPQGMHGAGWVAATVIPANAAIPRTLRTRREGQPGQKGGGHHRPSAPISGSDKNVAFGTRPQPPSSHRIHCHSRARGNPEGKDNTNKRAGESQPINAIPAPNLPRIMRPTLAGERPITHILHIPLHRIPDHPRQIPVPTRMARPESRIQTPTCRATPVSDHRSADPHLSQSSEYPIDP